MKKLSLLAAASIFALTGCAPSGIKCEYLSIVDGGNTILSSSSSFTTKTVYEYVETASNTKLYFDTCPVRYSEYGTSEIKRDIYLYKNRQSTTYRMFEFSRKVGLIKVETDYYLNLSKHSVVIMSHYEKLDDYEYNDTSEKENENKEAYRCIKKSYYQISGSYYSTEDNNVQIFANEVDKDLEHHGYIVYGSSASVAYTKAK
mgnify:CR=1 FL=1